jgi:hypothetical protein
MATDRDGNMLGVLPLYFSKSPLTGAYMSSLEDGVLAEWPDVVAALLQHARTLRDSMRARYLQVRGGSIDEPASITIPTVRTVINTGQGIDQLWSAIKKKTRWAIRQAQQQDVVVDHDTQLHELEAFYSVYAAHLRMLGTPVVGWESFQSMGTRLGAERLRLYLVRHGGSLIGGMLCILNRTRWTDYYAIVRPIEDIPFANYLLYWHVIRDASLQGAPYFDMGRSTPGSNVHMFKRKWGGSDVEVPYHFYVTPGAHARDVALQNLKRGRGLPQRIWSKLPLAVCNRLGPLLRKQLPFI